MIFLPKGTCNWNETSTGSFKWNRDRGGTPSSNTGPSVDHTLGNEGKSLIWIHLYENILKG